MEGINGISPVIRKINFSQRGKIHLLLEDGRSLTVPLKFFPSIRKLNSKKRNKYYVIDGQILVFHYSDEIYHIEQFLGKEQNYRYHFA